MCTGRPPSISSWRSLEPKPSDAVTSSSTSSRCAAIVFNPGAFTHYAYALTDALAAFDGVVVELHLSNPHARESWRHTSVVAPVATGTISGFGAAGYRLAIDAVAGRIDGTVEIEEQR